jgi:uncharacterized RmlC-like cupin family protein
MAEPGQWRDGVRLVRGRSLDATLRERSARGRATAFDFAGTGGQRTWIGTVRLAASASTGAHHHGRHEVVLYVVTGQSEIRWGERLEFVADMGPGDFAYFTPYVPHQERNPSATEAAEFLVVRSDNEPIAVGLDIAAVEAPQRAG